MFATYMYIKFVGHMLRVVDACTHDRELIQLCLGSGLKLRDAAISHKYHVHWVTCYNRRHS